MQTHTPRRTALPLAALLLATLLPATGYAQPAPLATSAQTSSRMQAGTAAKPIPPDQLASLLPPSVYFQGKSAPLQLRNAGALTLPGNAIVWAALVDTSGYASSVQERYQFYFVTETPLTVAGTTLAPGAYGGGFLGERFVLMDLGGHTVAEGPTAPDPALPRPRPLLLLPAGPGSLKLYLGRRWIALDLAPTTGTRH